ncbi:protoporphyrinogen oxidase [Nitrolancea hollandica]|uniref:Coproporphyrinogen III oxidase n=1 Tax=Nitrolancea hollandica Lb TaxID=1129897 RepID=I4EFF4_9BACT|nr:protoporphyrinogen oxidase [Nitrolancea hollandica]CCF83416.1 Protoporphyrinogen oxidase [Nitrolancea hollandica Lb]
MAHAVIAGGGISGLTAAYRLRRLARESGLDLRITLVEADTRLGGKILTERVDDLIIEAGPDSILSQKLPAIHLCQELGIADRLVGTKEGGGGTYILREGRLEPLPEGITMLVPTKLRPLIGSRLLSTRAKLRMGLDVLIPPLQSGDDESVAAFVTRRLGREAFERMAQPLLSGIYAGDAGKLSLAATFPRLRQIEREHGSLVRGMLAQRRQRRTASGSAQRYTPFVSLRGGIGELVDVLTAQLEDVDIRLGTAVNGIEQRTSGGYRVRLSDGETLETDVLLLATPADVSGNLLAPVRPDLAALLQQIPYVSSATITLAYRQSEVGKLGAGRGFVIPRVENRELTAVTWASSKFPYRAPEGLMLLRTFVGRAGRESAVDLPDDLILRLVREELREILGLTAQPVLSRIYRWHQALPQYVLGHLDRLAEIDRELADLPGLFLLGAAYRGVGIPDCIQSGNQAAERALALLKAQSSETSHTA